MREFNRNMRSLWKVLISIFSLVVTITSTNFQFRSQQHLTNPESSPLSPTIQPTDQSSLIYSSFIETLLQNEQFTTSLIQSVSNVFYNHWVIKLSKQLQKKYLKILLTTARNDQSGEMTSKENFHMLRKILEEPEMAKQFLKYLEFDFDSNKFKQFVEKYLKEEEKGSELGQLGDSDKARIYLLALEKQEDLELEEGKRDTDDKKQGKTENSETREKQKQTKINQKEE